jgi:thermostable 8-oxoguanine DNA glycosylase
VELKTVGGKKLIANSIACILTARVTGVNGTLVQLKTGEEVLLENSEEEVVEEMNKFDIEMTR